MVGCKGRLVPRSRALVDELETLRWHGCPRLPASQERLASNADYLYQRSGRNFFRPTLDAEWEALVEGLLSGAERHEQHRIFCAEVIWMAKTPKRVAKKVAQRALEGKIALVAGATRGAGRGIAIALGEAGVTVYCTGRSSRKHSRGRPATPGRPETIEETAELVTAAGGHGIAVRVDHTAPEDVKKLVAGIKRWHKGLDILVNDVRGGDAITEWGKTIWTVNLENGLAMLKQAIHSHIITSHYAVPLMLGRRGAIIFEITDGDAFYYRGNLFYDLVKISVIRLAFAMAR